MGHQSSLRQSERKMVAKSLAKPALDFAVGILLTVSATSR
jgi:hypothetical protein